MFGFICGIVASIKTAVVSAFNWCVNTVAGMIMSNLFGVQR